MFDKLLIGRDIAILSALDKSLIGRKGTVLDETKNTLLVGSPDRKIIRIPKSIVRVQILESEKERAYFVEGKAMLGTPVERIRG